MIIHGILGPFNGWLAGRVGPRPLLITGGCVLGVGLLLVAETTAWWHLYLTFGLIVAVGVAFAGWLPSILLVRGWFPDRVGTALGIASAGIGIGITGIVPLAQYFVDLVGWRWAYRILAAVVAGWVIPSSLWLIRNPAAPSRPMTDRRQPPQRTLIGHSPAPSRAWPFWGLAAVSCRGISPRRCFWFTRWPTWWTMASAP
ncbi:MAG: MFS transporter [Desulfobacterales bacterium]|nr:MFS transporter [Desulfobacterales bacterium]